MANSRQLVLSIFPSIYSTMVFGIVSVEGFGPYTMGTLSSLRALRKLDELRFKH